MRPITRVALSKRAVAFLKKRTDAVVADADPKARCEKLWKIKTSASFGEIRNALYKMSRGRLRCMYCEDNEATSIDHFWPKSQYPQKGFEWNNYLFACSNCNSNFKRNQFPLFANGTPALIDPSLQDPAEHMVLSFSTGKFVELTESARQSIRVFGLQRQTLVDGRRNAFHILCALLEKYSKFDLSTPPDEIQGVIAAMRQASFSSVLYFLLRALDRGNIGLVLSPQVVELIEGSRDLLAQF